MLIKMTKITKSESDVLQNWGHRIFKEEGGLLI